MFFYNIGKLNGVKIWLIFMVFGLDIWVKQFLDDDINVKG